MLTVRYAFEMYGGHAHDSERGSVEIEGATQRARIGREPAAPERLADDDDGVAAGHAVVVRCEKAPNRRLDAERLEVIPGHDGAVYDFGGRAGEADGDQALGNHSVDG